MALVTFVDDSAPYLNAQNLNGNFNEILDLTNIKVVDYSGTISNFLPNTSRYITISTSVPTGYTLIGYIQKKNGFISQIMWSIINSANNECSIGARSFSNETLNPTFYISGIYAKRVNQ